MRNGTAAGGTATKASSRERVARRKRAKAVPLQVDMRTRLARRVRSLEREYRAVLQARGVRIDISVDANISALAVALTHVEYMRAAASRGAAVDPDVMRSWIITAQKQTKALGLRPGITDAPAPQRPIKPLSHALRQAGMLP